MAFATHQSSDLVEVRTWWGGEVVGHVVWEVVMVWSSWSSVFIIGSWSPAPHQYPYTAPQCCRESIRYTYSRVERRGVSGENVFPALG